MSDLDELIDLIVDARDKYPRHHNDMDSGDLAVLIMRAGWQKVSELTPGTTLYGFCNGFFGRDSYGKKVIVAAGKHDGVNWVVAHDGDRLLFAKDFDMADTRAWLVEEDPEY